MQLFEISEHEFKGRFKDDKLPIGVKKLWLVNNEMAAVVVDNNEVFFFGSTELSEEDEFLMFQAVSPVFVEDYMEEREHATNTEDIENKRAKLRKASFLITWIPLTIIAALCVLALVYYKSIAG